MQLALNCDTIGDLANGTARATIDAAIRTVLADLDDRGEDGKPRIVEIKIECVKADSGLMTATVTSGAKLPVYRTAGTAGRLRHGDRQNPTKMLFQTMDAKDPDQTTIDQYETPGGLAPGEIPPGGP